MSFTIATNLDDALQALAAGAKPIAGGSDLVVGARHGKAPLPEHMEHAFRQLGFEESEADD